jgi:hypothetical protein
MLGSSCFGIGSGPKDTGPETPSFHNPDKTGFTEVNKIRHTPLQCFHTDLGRSGVEYPRVLQVVTAHEDFT